MVFTVDQLISTWESVGVFDLLLPFLLVFAVVYGVLQYTKIFGEEKAVRVILSVVIGLLAIRFADFTYFYSEVFPRLGIGLSVLLAIIILLGLFTTDKNRGAMMWIFFSIGAIIAVAVVYNSLTLFGWLGSFGGDPSEWIAWIISILLLIGVIVAIIVPKIEVKGNKPKPVPVALWQGN